MKPISLILVSLWGLGTSFLLFNALSRAAFSRKRFLTRLGNLACDIAFAIIWPIALLSSEGRAYINKTTKDWK